MFNCHSKTGIEFLFSESGAIPIRIKISVRRLLYWWHILNVSKSEMIFKVYSDQKLSPVAGDWVNLLEADNIKLSDMEIASISKQKFKNVVKNKAGELTAQYLQKLKRRISKPEHLDVSDMKTSEYLLDGRFSNQERELLFSLRSKTVLVKENFKNAYQNNNMLCELCQLFSCTQSHPLQCPKLNTKIIVDKKIKLTEQFIYGDVDQQLLYVKIYKQFWDLRTEMLSKLNK